MTQLRNIVKNLKKYGDLNVGKTLRETSYLKMVYVVGALMLPLLFTIYLTNHTGPMDILTLALAFLYALVAITVFIIICVSVAIVKRISLW